MGKVSEEQKQKMREYYQNNKETVLKQQKEYRDANVEKIKKRSKKYREENKEILSEKRKQPAKYDQFYDKISLYYGEDEIRRDPDNPDLIQVRCQNQNCREWFNPSINQLYNRLHSIYGIDGGSNYMYCSDECKKSCAVFGQREFPKGFLKSKKKSNNGREVPAGLRELVFDRDKYTCQKCGKSITDFPDLILQCHHIKPINEDPILEADKDNCITLCDECHKWVHLNIPGCSYIELQCTKTIKENKKPEE